MRNLINNYFWNDDAKAYIAISISEMKRLESYWESKSLNKAFVFENEREYYKNRYDKDFKLDSQKIVSRYYSIKDVL